MKKWLCNLFLFIMAAVSLSGCAGASASKEGLVSLQNVPKFSGDTVSASVYGDVLKLDDITAGLNTVTMKITLYSLTEQKILGQTDSLPEGDWSTGSFDGGFYAAALDRCEVILFNNQCKETSRIKPAGSGNRWAFAAVSPDKKYLFYGDAQEAETYVYSFADQSSKRVGIFTGYIEPAGFSDGCFFLKTGEGVLIKIDPEKDRSEVAFVDVRLNLKNAYYSVGTTDFNFMVMPPDQSSPRYTEILSVDEVPIAAGEPGFVTSASEVDNDILRVYRMKDARMFTVKVPETVEQVCFDDKQLVIVAKDEKSGQRKLYLHDADSEKASPITIYNSDQTPSYDNLPEVPVPTAPDVSASKTEADSLKVTEASSNESASLTTKKRIAGVPVIAQMPKYPTGCESVSAVMALQFAGESITVDDFIDQYLEKSSNFYNEGGMRYGPDPYEVFIGNPRSRSAFGCMAPVIEKALVKYYSSSNFVVNTTGKDMEELCRDYISQGIPVLVWTSINMIEPAYTSSWNLPNGEKYTWLSNEHCMLLIGYDEEEYYFNDPYTGKEVKYGKSLSQQRYEAFGRQSIAIKK